MPAKSKSGADLKSSEMLVCGKTMAHASAATRHSTHPLHLEDDQEQGKKVRVISSRLGASEGLSDALTTSCVRLLRVRATLVEKHVVVHESILSYSGQPNSC
jgi:hypothetical protein